MIDGPLHLGYTACTACIVFMSAICTEPFFRYAACASAAAAAVSLCFDGSGRHTNLHNGRSGAATACRRRVKQHNNMIAHHNTDTGMRMSNSTLVLVGLFVELQKLTGRENMCKKCCDVVIYGIHIFKRSSRTRISKHNRRTRECTLESS